MRHFNFRKVPFVQCDVEPSSLFNIKLRNGLDKDNDDNVCCPQSRIIYENVKKSCSDFQGFRCVGSEVSKAELEIFLSRNLYKFFFHLLAILWIWSLGKLNLAFGFGFKLEQILASDPDTSNNVTHFRSGQK